MYLDALASRVFRLVIREVLKKNISVEKVHQWTMFGRGINRMAFLNICFKKEKKNMTSGLGLRPPPGHGLLPPKCFFLILP